jgi:steroid delta-isomerase-like uncharacterized protein
MSEANKQLLQRWFREVWNEGREETVDEILAPDAIAHGLGETEPDVQGPEGFKVFLRTIRAAFPDVRIDVDDVLAEGDKIAARVTLQGTHTGEALGLPASGRRVTVAGIVLARFHDGQVAEAWNLWDQLGLLRQVGGVPAGGQDRFLARRS